MDFGCLSNIIYDRMTLFLFFLNFGTMCKSCTTYFQVCTQEYCLLQFIYAFYCGTFFNFKVCNFLKFIGLKKGDSQRCIHPHHFILICSGLVTHTFGWEVKLHVYGLVLNGVWPSGPTHADEMTPVYLVICYALYFPYWFFFFSTEILKIRVVPKSFCGLFEFVYM